MTDITTTRQKIEKIDAALEHLGGGEQDSFERVDLLNEKALYVVAADQATAKELCHKSLQIAETLQYEKGKAYSLGITGYAHFLVSDFAHALPLLLDSVALFDKIDDPYGKGMVLSALGGLYMSLGDFEKALGCSLQSLELSRAAGSKREEAWCLYGLGTGYFEIGDEEQALRYYREGLDVFREIEETVGEARMLIGIGTVYRKAGKYEEARSRFLEGLKLFQQSANKHGEARAYHELGQICQLVGEEEAARSYYLKSLVIREELGNRQAQSTSLITLGLLYIQQGHVDEALEVLEEALSIATDIEAKPRQYQAHEALSEAYLLKKDLMASFEHFKAFHQIKSVVLGEEANARLSNLKVAYEVEKARHEAEIIRDKNKALNEKNTQLKNLLDELKGTQKQLIQSEKMASLGQLTAGIAHEIKNPLNFVNNFSELAVELARELKEELFKRPEKTLQEMREDLEELLSNIEMTADKINEHGRRADEIVRSMLLHARQQPGESQPVLINNLLDEYVNLAYHGMRANVENFNVTINREFDQTVGLVEVVAQEMGRVFLNLINNAFQAVYARTSQGDDSYDPSVWICTQKKGEVVEIRIRDNGSGVPQNILDRVFEPFFTTKPTGEGTGLGLSLSFEIVTKGHGGTLTIESTESKGATFIITLPVQKDNGSNNKTGP